MKLRRRALWSAGAMVAGLGVAALAVTAVVGSVRSLARVWHSDWATAAIVALAVAFTLLVSAGLFWVAWRLWRRWSAGTVRLATGVAVAGLALYVHHLIFEMVAERAEGAWEVAATPILLLAVIAYRKTSRAVIRWSELEDPLDAHGNPAGHMERVRAFCVMLGVSVWFGGFGVAMAMRASERMQDVGGFGVIASMALGWLVYRVTLWWMTPPTKPALPPGRGFEILPAEQKT